MLLTHMILTRVRARPSQHCPLRIKSLETKLVLYLSYFSCSKPQNDSQETRLQYDMRLKHALKFAMFNQKLAGSDEWAKMNERLQRHVRLSSDLPFSSILIRLKILSRHHRWRLPFPALCVAADIPRPTHPATQQMHANVRSATVSTLPNLCVILYLLIRDEPNLQLMMIRLVRATCGVSSAPWDSSGTALCVCLTASTRFQTGRGVRCVY